MSSASTVLIAVATAAMLAGADAQPAPVKTTVCELLQSPEKFNGKLVQVRAKYRGEFEWSGLVDETCHGNLLWNGEGFRAFESESGEYAFIRYFSDTAHPDRLDWKPISVPKPVHLMEDEAYREFQEAAAKNPLRHGPATVEITLTVTGRFDHLEQQMIVVRETPDSKPKVRLAGFGHLNAGLNRLVWQSVSDVVVMPAPRP